MAEAAQPMPAELPGTPAAKQSRPGQVLLPPDSPDATMRKSTWGPRTSMAGAILPRSVLGDPQEYSQLARQHTSHAQTVNLNASSNSLAPTSPGSPPENHARFSSVNSIPEVTTPRDGGGMRVQMSNIVDTMDMDAEATLRSQLATLTDAKRKQRDDKVAKIKGMHIFERFNELRETRILGKHKKRQAQWEAFRQRMAKRLHKDPDDLVINRAEEYRMMLEEQDLISKATPVENRHGDNVWLMSLRDAWTRYISVGGPFSGLEMPFIDRPELRPDSMYWVRQPFSKPAADLQKTRASGTTTKQRLRNEYAEAIEYLQPHEVEFEGLFIKGRGVEQDVKVQLEQTVAEKQAAEDQRLKEEETMRRRQQRMPNFSQAGSTANKSAPGAPSEVGGASTVAPTQGLDASKWEPEVQGPSMTFETDRLLMEGEEGGVCEQSMSCMNIGSTAVYYRWTRTEKRFEGVSPIDNLPRFHLSDLSGAILPGEMKLFNFTFKSDKPGVFSEEWVFEGRPDVAETQHAIALKGVCQIEDKSKVDLELFEANLEGRQMQATVNEVVDELVDHVQTPRAKPRVLTEDPDVDRQVFIARNKEAQIYYSNTTLKLFRSLADSTFELLNFPEELRAWDSSLESLKRLIYAIEDDGERERHIIQFNETMKVAGIPPTSTSMFNSICYELVAELADGIPDIASDIRKKLNIKV
uniref:MYCBP-associated protein n=1 Tax=Hemiselmis andersenii TaxID=464988 RepID=A0A7S1EDU6_HEMAN|mmetsp:Transcript_42198/g.103056  ORF Transcript_42198/g.103056 Transcript_42198/m.103056 type:complete len:695 (+) Transcript_42198:45-2129(+)